MFDWFPETCSFIVYTICMWRWFPCSGHPVIEWTASVVTKTMVVTTIDHIHGVLAWVCQVGVSGLCGIQKPKALFAQFGEKFSLYVCMQNPILLFYILWNSWIEYACRQERLIHSGKTLIISYALLINHPRMSVVMGILYTQVCSIISTSKRPYYNIILYIM